MEEKIKKYLLRNNVKFGFANVYIYFQNKKKKVVHGLKM